MESLIVFLCALLTGYGIAGWYVSRTCNCDEHVARRTRSWK